MNTATANTPASTNTHTEIGGVSGSAPKSVAPSPVAVYMTELQNIQNQKAQLASRENELNQMISDARAAELRELPQRLGYTDSDEFLRTFAQVNNVRNVARINRPASTGNRRGAQASTGRKSRVTITPEVREKIKHDFRAGKLDKEQICDKYDISPAAAQVIKKEAGMVRPHKK